MSRAEVTELAPADDPAWWPASRFPVTRRFIEIDGNRVHYVDEGEGPPLLLLHGNPTWSFVYRDIIAELSSRFRCIAPDYPGFGLSEAREGYDFRPASHTQVVTKLIEALDLQGITMMVQDWGGPIGLGAAGRLSERFKALVIGNTFAWPVNGDPHFERFSGLMGGPIGRFLIRYFNAFVNVMVPMGVKRKKVRGEIIGAYRAPFPTRASRWPTYVFPREIIHGSEFLAEVEHGLVKIEDLPALILWGDRDIAFRAKERSRFEQIFANHQTQILEGAGHFIQEDAAAEIVAAITAWDASRRTHP